MNIEDEISYDDMIALCKSSQFKIFNNRIVAADNGSSGDASKCALELIRKVQQFLINRSNNETENQTNSIES